MSLRFGTGNNIPVFFIKDGLKFPDLVHALRPNPKNHIQEGWRILDFLAHHPESTHMVRLDKPYLPSGSFAQYLLLTFLLSISCVQTLLHTLSLVCFICARFAPHARHV
jgi:hypothetical protein